MIEIITGVPGSGKSYKAVYSLFNNFGLNKKVKDKKFIFKDVTSALTNINELDLTKFKNVYKLEWDNFYQSLQELHNYYLAKCTDTELQDKAKKLKIYEVLIILDECHNYLESQDKVLVWWLSYHRHLHQQIYLITQNLSLVSLKYKAFSEFFYKAFPSSLKLFGNSMKYNEYTSSRMSNTTKSGVVKLPVKKEIFDTYGSGANQKSKSVVLKFVIMFIFLIVLTVLAFKFVSMGFGDKSVVEEIQKEYKTTEKNIKSTPVPVPIDYDTNDKYYMSLLCNLKTRICLYKSKVLDLDFYLSMLQKFDYLEISKSKINNTDFVKLNVFVDEKFYYIYNERSKKNDKKNFNNSIFPSSDSSK